MLSFLILHAAADSAMYTTATLEAVINMIIHPHPYRCIRREIISAFDAFGMHILVCTAYDENAIFCTPCPPTNKHACAIVGNAVMYMTVATTPPYVNNEYRPTPKMNIPFLLTPREGMHVLTLRNARKTQEAHSYYKMQDTTDIDSIIASVVRIYSRFSYKTPQPSRN